jgi:hypothetical protein
VEAVAAPQQLVWKSCHAACHTRHDPRPQRHRASWRRPLASSSRRRPAGGAPDRAAGRGRRAWGSGRTSSAGATARGVESGDRRCTFIRRQARRCFCTADAGA